MKLIYQLLWETMLSILARYFLKILDVGNFPWYVRYDQKTYLNMVKHTSKTPMFFKTLGICPTECCEFALQILNVGFISPGPRVKVRKTTTTRVTFGSDFLKRAARMFSRYQFVRSLFRSKGLYLLT